MLIAVTSFAFMLIVVLLNGHVLMLLSKFGFFSRKV